MASLIDAYLDELLGALRSNPHEARRILAEAEDHLRETAAAIVATGISEEASESAAIARFGSAEVVARRFEAELGLRLSRRTWYLRAYLNVATLGSIGLIAIGLSAVLALLAGQAFGPKFVAGDIPGASYTAERCAYFLEYYPNPSGDCLQAAASHHFEEIVMYGIALGVVGLIVLGTHAWARRRYVGPDGERSLLRRARSVLGMAAFGAAGAALTLNGLNWLVRAPDAGAGLWLAQGLVAFAFFLLFLQPGLRSLREMASDYAA